MKKQLKKWLILALMALAALFTLAGCKLGESFEDVIKENNLVSHITYYANAEQATFTPNTSKSRDLWYKKDARPFNIGVDDGELGIKYDGYEIVGWYHVARDENGEPITTGSYTYKDETYYLYQLTDQKVDFSQNIQEGTHWIVAAKWAKISRVNVYLVHDEENVTISLDTSKTLSKDSPLYNKQTNSFKATVTDGDWIESYRYEADGVLTMLPYNPIPIYKNEYTFVSYYMDEACTQPVSYPLIKTDDDQKVYAKYITGNWTVVRTADAVADMFENFFDSTMRFYLLPNVTIDCKDISIEKTYTTACEIQGNGAVLKNLTLDKPIEGEVISLFGEILSTAKIENLSFENFNMTFTARAMDFSLYVVFEKMETGATINNVNIQGSCTIFKSDRVNVENMFGAGGAMVYTHCLFGEPYATDEEYYAQHPNGFKVAGDSADFITITKKDLI